MLEASLGRLFVSISAKMGDLARDLNIAKGQIKSFSMTSGNYIQQHSAQFRKAGMMITAAGGIMALAFTKLMKPALSFQTQLGFVSTMLDDSTKFYDEYKEGLSSMAIKFGESTDTLSKGLYDILSASIPPEEALKVLDVSARAASAGLTDTGTAADAVTTILNSYGLSADKAGDVSDLLFAIVKRGKTTFAELAPAIGKVASISAQSGLALEEMGAMLAITTRAGIRTAEATTALSGVLRAFLKPQEKSIKAFKEYADSIGETTWNLDTATLSSVGLQKMFLALKDANVEQIAAMFGNIRGLKGVLAAMSDLEGHAKDLDIMYNRLGMTEKAFEEQTATTQYALNQMKQAMIAFIKEAVWPLLEPLKELAIRMKNLAMGMREIAVEFPEVAKVVGLIAAGLTAIMIVVGPLLLLLPTIVKGAALLKKGFLLLSGTLVVLKTSVVAFISAWGPYLAILGLATLAVDKLIKKWKETQDSLRETSAALHYQRTLYRQQIELMEWGFKIAKKYHDLDVMALEDKKSALEEINLGIKGLRTSQATISDENAKINIQKEIDALLKKRETLEEVLKVRKEVAKDEAELSEEEKKKLEEIAKLNKELQIRIFEYTHNRYTNQEEEAKRYYEKMIKEGANEELAKKELELRLAEIHKERLEEEAESDLEFANRRIDFIGQQNDITLTKKIELLEALRIEEQIAHDSSTEAYKAYTDSILDLERMKNETIMSQTLNLVGSIGRTLQTHFNLRRQNIQYELEDSLSAEDKKYENAKEMIEANVEDEEEKDEALRELEEAHAETTEKLRKDAEDREREARRKLKPIMIAQAFANVAQGVTKAFAQGGILGFITGALVMAAGMAQIAIIKAQRFQKGGIVKGIPGEAVQIIAEPGEVILPLNLVETLREILTKSPIASPVFQEGGIVGGISPIAFGDINIDLRIDKFSSENLEEACRQISIAVREGIPEGIELAKLIHSTGIKRGLEAF